MKAFWGIALLAIVISSKAQTNGAYYRVNFVNKSGSPYSVNEPEQFLSQRAIERRNKMGIAVNESDIPVVQAYLDGIKATGASIINTSKWFNSATIFVTDTSVINSITSLDYVISVDKTKPWLPQRKKKPMKSGTQSLSTNVFSLSAQVLLGKHFQYFSKRILTDYGNGFNQANMIGVDYLHNNGFKGEGMVIAVLDAGFYHVNTLHMFDSLRSTGRILGYYDFVMPGNNLFEESTHGMQVLSTMGGNIPGLLVGTAPHASYWLLRSEDAGSEYVIEEDNWIAAAEFADSVGADVINSSLGYTDFDDIVSSHTYEQLDGNTTRVTRGADMAASKGILVVNSAGNSGNDSWLHIGAPADADSILTIGAVDSYGNFASFSSHGPSYDGQVKPTVAAQGQGTYVVSTSDGVYPGNGTSFSSPVLAGAVTCLWQANPTLSNMEVIEVVKKSGSQFANPDSLLGYGIPNMAVAHMISGGVSIEQNTSENKLLVNPNPFTSEIDMIVYATKSMTATISLIDGNGKDVFTREDIALKSGYNYTLLEIPSSIPSGMYILGIKTSSWKTSTKLIKN